MTSLDTLERSVEGSRPYELYQFTLGTTPFRFTSADANITYLNNVYVANGVSRSGIEIDSESSRSTLRISIPSSETLAQSYKSVPPGVLCTLRILRFQYDESPAQGTALLLYEGNVKSVRFTSDLTTAEIAVQSLESDMAKNVPRVTFAGQCSNFLYDQYCRVNPALHNYTGSVTAVDGNSYTVAGLGASSVNFLGGYARPVGADDYRLVIDVQGNDIRLIAPFGSDLTGTDLQIFGGCDHIIDGDCALVYDNVINYLGFAFVPGINPFRQGVIT